MDAGEETFKILMLPWLAHGHISPFLELAKRLTKKKFIVYFCSTPVNLDAIKTNLSEDCSSIEFVEIHLQSTPDLPPHYHTAKGLPIHLMQALMEAFAIAAPNLHTILQTLNPDLLIVDFLLPWTIQIASSLNIPLIFFSIFSAVSLSYAINRTLDDKSPFLDFKFHDFWKSKHPELYDLGETKLQPLYDHLLQSSEIIVVKTSREIEEKYIGFLSSSLKKKIVTTGPMAAQPPLSNKSEIIDWLEKKPPFSTVFVAFGSECYPSNEEIEEIAYGLEISEVNFVWILRFPMGKDMKLEETLPKGFIERVGERGKVIEGWAPQVEILKHSSIGGHVSHCGWSSLMECLVFGVPVICVPMQLDSPICAKLMAEIGVGLEVKRDEGGRITRDEVAIVVKKVVSEKSGEGFRKKVKELSSVLAVRDEEEIDELAMELVRLCENKRIAAIS